MSMVPNNHLGSLLNGITISWKRANLVAISAEMAGSESCSVRMRVFWENKDTHLCFLYKQVGVTWATEWDFIIKAQKIFSTKSKHYSFDLHAECFTQ